MEVEQRQARQVQPFLEGSHGHAASPACVMMQRNYHGAYGGGAVTGIAGTSAKSATNVENLATGMPPSETPRF